MLFSFAPQTAYAGGVVNAVADLVSSVVETVVDVAKEVMSNPVLGIVVSVALMVVFPYSGGVFGAIFPEATALFPAADFFGAALLGYNVLCATEVAFCGDDDNSNPGAVIRRLRQALRAGWIPELEPILRVQEELLQLRRVRTRWRRRAVQRTVANVTDRPTPVVRHIKGL